MEMKANVINHIFLPKCKRKRSSNMSMLWYYFFHEMDKCFGDIKSERSLCSFGVGRWSGESVGVVCGGEVKRWVIPNVEGEGRKYAEKSYAVSNCMNQIVFF